MTKSLKHDRPTVGSLVYDTLQQATDTHDVRDQGGEMIKPYLGELFVSVDKGKELFEGDFFIEVQQQRFVLLAKVLRNYFIPRSTCPTPNYDQSVYRFDRKNDELEYIWTIPDRESAFDLIANALTIEDEYRELLQYVLDFKDGTLFKLAQTLNNEDGLKTGVTLQVLDDKQSNEAEEHRRRTDRLVQPDGSKS